MMITYAFSLAVISETGEWIKSSGSKKLNIMLALFLTSRLGLA